MKYPKTIKFRVLQRDIDKAVKAREKMKNVCRECILAQAAKRILKPKYPYFISVGTLNIKILKGSIDQIAVASYRIPYPLIEYTNPSLDWEEAKPSKLFTLNLNHKD